jgi:hypothetical protein
MGRSQYFCAAGSVAVRKVAYGVKDINLSELFYKSPPLTHSHPSSWCGSASCQAIYPGGSGQGAVDRWAMHLILQVLRYKMGLE